MQKNLLNKKMNLFHKKLIWMNLENYFYHNYKLKSDKLVIIYIQMLLFQKMKLIIKLLENGVKFQN